MARTTATIIGLIALLAPTAASAVDDLTLHVAGGSQDVMPGDTVTVTLDVSGLSAAVNGVQALMRYDTSILTLVGIEPTNLGLAPPANGWVEIVDVDNAGDITYAAAVNGGQIGLNHTVATLTFTVVAEGTTNITFRPDIPPFFNKLTVASDSSVLSPTVHDSTTIGSDCDDGLYCNGLETFDGLVCQPGADPCDDSVACTVDTCAEATDTCTNTPTDALCDNGLFCDGAETCHQMQGCQAGSDPCDDSVGCTDDSCDEANDICTNAPNDTLCDNGDWCDGAETCDVLLDCQSGTAPDCDDTVGCTVDTCDEINDTCVNTATDSLCDNGLWCDGVETCDEALDCQSGTAPDCGDTVGCTVDTCDEVNDICVNTPTDSLCDNGLFCDGVETCDVLLDCQDGNTVDCDDSVGCTVDTCDEVNDTCVNTPNDSLCDNGLFCDGVETCDLLLDCQDGTTVDCDDSVGCTVDTCDEVNDTCVNTPTDSLCDNGLYCDGVETCDLLLDCQDGNTVDCDDSVGCTVDSCDEVNDTCVNTPTDSLCDNGLFCDGVETCDALLDCQDGNTVDCDDSVGCTVDSCDEVNDTCVNTATDSLCDNGLFCDGVETCDALLDCQDGNTVDCDDSVGCTVDSCDEVNDTCVNTPTDSLCDNGLWCDGVETCDALLDCQDGNTVDCDDSVACTDDSCDEVNDVCVNTPNDTLCDNGQFCDGVEVCDVLLGCQDGADPDCNDLVACTDDSCDEVGDTCVNAPNNSLCDNGMFCDGAETCDPDVGCLFGEDPCDDGVTCTVDTCDEAEDSCDNAPDNAVCDNGLWCDGAEICDPLLDCQDGNTVDCDDSVGCTVDSCDEVNDICVNTPTDALCDNGLWCDGAETCDASLDCQAGIDPCFGALCDEDNDTCVPAPRVAGIELYYAGRFSDATNPNVAFLATGSVATASNIINATDGITGLIITFDDIVDFTTTSADAITLDWTTGTGSTFSAVDDVATTVTVTDEVVVNATVVTIEIDAGHITRRWLRVTVDASQVTVDGVSMDGELIGNPVALPGGDGMPGGNAVFYVGNMAGDVNGDRKTTLTDVGAIRAEVNPFLSVPMSNVYDVDKDGKVQLTDVGKSRLVVNPFFTLPLIAP